ncbi:hypothetical protein BV25DRAFT_1992084 [Artomyces pyxidatus]|uniref:Uncharacterized protein n=1 Tax=Artomyces pyxidatus TaxID=48021 RepID=A0ACB8SZT1_9AGAM|nr:hypothetical protein BV25DRAFT_1992084 [Artomyces pyxidatus]
MDSMTHWALRSDSLFGLVAGTKQQPASHRRCIYKPSAPPHFRLSPSSVTTTVASFLPFYCSSALISIPSHPYIMAVHSNFPRILALCICATAALALPATPLPLPGGLGELSTNGPVPVAARDSPSPPSLSSLPDIAASANHHNRRMVDDSVADLEPLKGLGLTYHHNKQTRSVDDSVLTAGATKGPGPEVTYHRNTHTRRDTDPLASNVGVQYHHPTSDNLRRDGPPPPPPPPPKADLELPSGLAFDLLKADLRRQATHPPAPRDGFSIPGGQEFSAGSGRVRRDGPPPPPAPKASAEIPSDGAVDVGRFQSRSDGPPPPPPERKTSFSIPSGSEIQLLHMGMRDDDSSHPRQGTINPTAESRHPETRDVEA